MFSSFLPAAQETVCDDVLGVMMMARDRLTGQGMSDAELYDQVITLMLAGHEVSSEKITSIVSTRVQDASFASKLSTLGMRLTHEFSSEFLCQNNGLWGAS